LRVGVRIVDPKPSDVYARAIRHELSAYDGAYVSLASALGTILWTGDKQLRRATEGRRPAVRWIGDYESPDD
jgi:predicted nucleic acid-binding protein